MYLGMTALLEKELITNETAIRYIAGHPVSGFTLGMFFIGVASLVMISCNLFAQYRWSSRIGLDNAFELIRKRTSSSNESGDDDASDLASDEQLEEENEGALTSDPESAGKFARALMIFPAPIREHYLWRRLHDALHFIHRTGSSAGIEDELKYLGDMDNERQQQRYSLVRILIWATPMLGFLGTVLGISQALGGINVGPDNDFQQMMGSLRGSLYVAFDTTALALVLSMVLMFGQFFVDRFESQLLSLVDHRSRRELSSHFIMSSTGDEVTDSVQRLGRTLLTSSNEMVRHQTAIWTRSIAAAERAWVDTLAGASEQVSENLTSALDQSVESLAGYLGQTIERADDSMTGRLEQWQVSLSENARRMREHQDELIRHTDLITELVDKIGSVNALESTLAVNSEAVEANKKLQETLQQLVAAVSAANKSRSLVAEMREQVEEASTASTAIHESEDNVSSEAFGPARPFLIATVSHDNSADVTSATDEPAIDEPAIDEPAIESPTTGSSEVNIDSDRPAILPIRSAISQFKSVQPEAGSIDVVSEVFTETEDQSSGNDPLIDEFAPTIPFPSAEERASSNGAAEENEQRYARYLRAEVESGEAPSLTFPVQIQEQTGQRTKKAA